MTEVRLAAHHAMGLGLIGSSTKCMHSKHISALAFQNDIIVLVASEIPVG